MASREIEVQNKLGIHARPSSLIVRTLGPLDATVTFSNGRLTASGKNILELLSLAAGKGTTLTVTATGPEADMALDAIEQLVADNFLDAY